MLREVSFGQDGSYSAEGIKNRINSDLANDLGNLAQRSLSMIAKNCGGVVPEHGEFTAEDQKMLDDAAALLEPVRVDFDQQAFHKALERIWHVIADCNRYFTAQEPWKLKKTDEERMKTVLFVTAETIRQVALLVQPVMPSSMGKMLDLLAVADDDRQFSSMDKTLTPGTELPQPAPVFPRYEEPKTDS